jgi:hypothetical protein
MMSAPRLILLLVRRYGFDQAVNIVSNQHGRRLDQAPASRGAERKQ